MDTSMSAAWRGGANHPVAIEVEGQMVFHVQLRKLKKYPQLYRQIISHAPSYIYSHAYNGVEYSYYGNPGPFYINLRAVPQGAGHILGDFLSFGSFTLQDNLSEKRQEEDFKSIIHLHNVADQFSMDDLKSDCEVETFRKAQDMGLMELVRLLEEANYRSDLFPKFSVYLEKRLVGSALDYGVGDSQRAFAELTTQPSLSVAQMLLKALTEISDVRCKLGEQNSMIGEVYRRKVAEATAASEFIGWEEPKSPETRWMKPKSEITGLRKSVGSRFFGPAAQQKDRNGMKNSPGRPFQGATAPEPTFYPPREPAFVPPSMFSPSLTPRRFETVPCPSFKDQSTTSRRGNIPYAHEAKTQAEIEGAWEMKALQRQEQKIPHISEQVRQPMAQMACKMNWSQRKHNAPTESPAPGPSTTSGEPLSETATGNDGDTEDDDTEACDRPVTQIGSDLNLPEFTVTSFDAPVQSSESSSDTLEGDPVEVEGPMDWDVGSSEYDYIP
ncbi:hypothetical protein FAGAP_8216 [Fusarium agapanthi]|uniref:BTB domain-containing protein n=1 Tax=Fusarium agapanthi TaxID=1803897 RepID=A0A9P5B649_9HYPO|nr:hypothetical protein FAGAP_8216 [Fusarium agapanthi]